jgi:hypothetical protein
VFALLDFRQLSAFALYAPSLRNSGQQQGSHEIDPVKLSCMHQPVSGSNDHIHQKAPFVNLSGLSGRLE